MLRSLPTLYPRCWDCLDACSTAPATASLGRLSRLLHRDPTSFPQAGFLPDSPSQKIELSSAHLAVPQHFHLLDARGMEEECAFHPNAVRSDPAHRKAGVCSTPADPHHHTLEYLDTLTVPFHDPVMHPYGVSWAQFGDVGIGLQTLNETHECAHRSTTFRRDTLVVPFRSQEASITHPMASGKSSASPPSNCLLSASLSQANEGPAGNTSCS